MGDGCAVRGVNRTEVALLHQVFGRLAAADHQENAINERGSLVNEDGID